VLQAHKLLFFEDIISMSVEDSEVSPSDSARTLIS